MSSAYICVTQYRWGKIPAGQVVSQLAQRGDGSLASLEEVASTLCISPRTLRRRLSKEGLSYRNITESIRRSRGQELLSSGSDAIEAVAATVGYSTTAPFYRAFQRWHGMTPAAYRRQWAETRVAACS